MSDRIQIIAGETDRTLEEKSYDAPPVLRGHALDEYKYYGFSNGDVPAVVAKP
jgi:hypothetical protein